MTANNDWGSVLIPMIRKMMPTLVAQDIVGVQPMGPITNERLTPDSYLHQLYARYILWKSAHPQYDNHVEQVTEMMQERFPGPYTIVEFYNRERCCFDLKIAFEDPKQETMWRIKYS